ncbi:MAG: hypothetical protein K0Q46_6124 [Rhodococcus erythropolis]|nr:hypothetical protein [Rhodococcus erythropolis]
MITLPSWTSVQLLQNSALSNEVPPTLRITRTIRPSSRAELTLHVCSTRLDGAVRPHCAEIRLSIRRRSVRCVVVETVKDERPQPRLGLFVCHRCLIDLELTCFADAVRSPTCRRPELGNPNLFCRISVGSHDSAKARPNDPAARERLDTHLRPRVPVMFIGRQRRIRVRMMTDSVER